MRVSEMSEKIKRETRRRRTEEDVSIDVLRESLEKISEINVAIGLSRAPGMESLYYETVEYFSGKLQADCDKMSAMLRDGDLAHFMIAVHAMKSSLAAIGAMGLSETAIKLEMAAKNGEAETCVTEYQAFQESLLVLREQLEVVFPPKKSTERTPGDDELLLARVPEALRAVDDFDDEAATAAIGELLRYDFGEQINALLEEAMTAADDFDFRIAAAALKKVID